MCLDDERLQARLGRWTFHVPVADLAGAEVVDHRRRWRLLGVWISSRDMGLRLTTSAGPHVHITFRAPVTGPIPPLRHPWLTVTVDDPLRLVCGVRQHVDAREFPGPVT